MEIEKTEELNPKEEVVDESLQKVTIGDQEFAVTEEMAKALNSQKEEFDSALSEIRNETKTQIQDLQKEIKPVEKKEEELDVWSDPAGYIKNQIESAKTEIETKLTGAYNKQVSQQKFWDNFYAENDDLKDDKFMVEAVMGRDWNELGSMDGSKAAKKLAERTRKEILKLNPQKKVKQVKIEGGSIKQEKPPEKVEVTDIKFGDVLKNRAKARRESRKTA